MLLPNVFFDAVHGFFHFGGRQAGMKVDVQGQKHVVGPKVHAQGLLGVENRRVGLHQGADAAEHVRVGALANEQALALIRQERRR